MTLLLNILWFIFGGFAAGIAWLVGGCVLALTIVGLPWTAAAFRIGLFSFAPFGRHVVPRQYVTGREDPGTGCLGVLLNIVWFLVAGWWIALAHVVLGFLLCLTIIGIPFGVQHFKLAVIALAPIGKAVTEPRWV